MIESPIRNPSSPSAEAEGHWRLERVCIRARWVQVSQKTKNKKMELIWVYETERPPLPPPVLPPKRGTQDTAWNGNSEKLLEGWGWCGHSPQIHASTDHWPEGITDSR